MEKNKTQQEILNFIKQNKNYIKKTFHIKKIGLYGSYIENKQKPESDIDIVVEVPKKFKKFKTFLAMKTYFEKNLGKKIDLVFIDSLNPIIFNEINEEIVYV